jgi:hypothetical protein
MALIPPTISHSPQSNPLYASSTGAWISSQINADAVTAGSVTCDTFLANSVIAGTQSIVGAATTALFDFGTDAHKTAFPAGCSVVVQFSDGAQPANAACVFANAVFGISAANVPVFGTQSWTGSEAGVTSVQFGATGTSLIVTIAGKTTTSTAIFTITRTT